MKRRSEQTKSNQTKMGNISAKTLGKKSKNKFRVLMVGLDESGKTTILYRLKMYETYKTEPTIGFNVEEFSNQNGKISMNIWDLGGKKHLRRLWRHYYPGTQGVIFVFDSSDDERYDVARKEFIKIMNDRAMKDCSQVLVFANKQDAKNAVQPEDLPEFLGLDTMQNVNWLVQPSCAITGDGLEHGLDWMTKSFTQLHREKKRAQLRSGQPRMPRRSTPVRNARHAVY
ncbi:Oidioi.mRNA.OKI2018_I69.chr1.g3699.t1.cds [Oikopleura dioica]|uniref:Oidioi.mRNA.OKI2018_I69.chr1.g3699.t1.cds n=1 Tax=Oikopleura dioica TaxID=34765 RepID=A0ABN7SYY1_OIKDI|nr:Oidioi.mRNA.OKI2018_I69.chr1.g3699.t1.cds [Oikopleura dioica]